MRAVLLLLINDPDQTPGILVQLILKCILVHITRPHERVRTVDVLIESSAICNLMTEVVDLWT